MRSGFSEGLMGVGGIFLAFGFTVIVIGMFARMNTNTQAELPAITKLATVMVGVGAAMFVVGYLLARMGRSGDDYRERERITP
jgi:membrane-bound ClpP family serine protease